MFLACLLRVGQELTAPIDAPSKGISPESLEATGKHPRLSEQVAEHLRVHMSFTQPTTARSQRCLQFSIHASGHQSA